MVSISLVAENPPARDQAAGVARHYTRENLFDASSSE